MLNAETPSITEQRWRAPYVDPLYGSCVQPDRKAMFSATVRELILDRVQVRAVASTPYRFAVPAETAACAAQHVSVWALGYGEAEVVSPTGSFVMRRGDAAIGGTVEGVVWHARTDSRLLQSVVPVALIPPEMLGPHRFPRLLTRTALVNGYFAFLSALLSGEAAAFEAGSARYLEESLFELHLAVLSERVVMSPSFAPRTSIRAAIEAYVEANLADPGLDPTRVAAAVGISVRAAHQRFADGQESLAEYIRNRRLDRLQAALRDPLDQRRLKDLAVALGFSSGDVMARAFRRRFGVSPTIDRLL